MPIGILNLLKPPGMTSHDAVSFIRRTYGLKRVGHAGTLDPAAAGVLPVFLGQATRFIEYSTDTDKSYRVELTFGYQTDTGDDTGRVINTCSGNMPEQEKIYTALQSFVGTIDQLPPMYSAIKIQGKKLYELARDGITVERQPRAVTIYNITVVKFTQNGILFDVTCSKGTYIRSLCMDIGEKLGCPAVMSFLVRTRVGRFLLSDAKTIEEVTTNRDNVLLPPDKALEHLPAIILPPDKTQAFQHGRSISYEGASCGLARIYDQQSHLIGVGQYSINSSVLTPVKVLSL